MVGNIAFKLLLPLAITFSLFLMFERPFAVAISAVSGGSFIAIACVHRGNSFVYLQERRGGPVGSWLRTRDASPCSAPSQRTKQAILSGPTRSCVACFQ